jgi:hypothetical protein
MDSPPPRVVTLVLVDAGGAVLGALAPFTADTPWWMDMGPVVDAVLARDGVRVTVLRILRAEQAAAHGGAVTYLAQLDANSRLPATQPWAGELPDDPKRHAYARVNGPAADLAWAAGVLEARGAALAGPPRQIRTWNLSSLWCLGSSMGTVWLKVVPPFFAHEGGVLATLVDAPVPRLLGREGCRMLLAEVEGTDLYGAKLPRCLAMIDLLVGLQSAWLGRADELAPLGLPDWRGPAMTLALGTLVQRRAGEFAKDDRAVLTAFVSGLPARFAALADCGIPDGLVHGDFHPGNFRGQAKAPGEGLSLLDWADSGLGHPLLDQPAFLDRMVASGVAAARAHWAAAWRRAVPQADVERAAHLLAPIANARQALIYQRFLDGIEQAERPYHEADVGSWLRRTIKSLP